MKFLSGIRALVTSGPTVEPIDPVRYISNRSSGRQGHAVAAALRDAGAEVTLVSGPVALPDPPGIIIRHVQTAREMLEACQAALPVEVLVAVAAVADWRVAEPASEKLKKGQGAPVLRLVENPDILATLAKSGGLRPALVIGFAAETGDLLARAAAKRISKGCDWMVANDVSDGKAFDAQENEVMLITPDGSESWPRSGKRAVADRLAAKIGEYMKGKR